VRDYYATSTFVATGVTSRIWQLRPGTGVGSVPPEYDLIDTIQTTSTSVSDANNEMPSQAACFVVNADSVRQIPIPGKLRSQLDVMAGPSTFVGGRFGSDTSKSSAIPPAWVSDDARPVLFQTLLAYGLDDQVVAPRDLVSFTPIYSYGPNATRFANVVDATWYSDQRFLESRRLSFIKAFSNNELPPAMLASCVLSGTCTVDTRAQDVGPSPDDPIWEGYYSDTGLIPLPPGLFEKDSSSEETSAPGWTASVPGAFLVATWDWGGQGGNRDLLQSLGFPNSDLSP
jgi:hypothetical protein